MHRHVGPGPTRHKEGHNGLRSVVGGVVLRGPPVVIEAGVLAGGHQCGCRWHTILLIVGVHLEVVHDLGVPGLQDDVILCLHVLQAKDPELLVVRPVRGPDLQIIRPAGDNMEAVALVVEFGIWDLHLADRDVVLVLGACPRIVHLPHPQVVVPLRSWSHVVDHHPAVANSGVTHPAPDVLDAGDDLALGISQQAIFGHKGGIRDG
mmetsp:Transcript_4872/g.17540  ORF Transcript_4872/g.17540 Transcript_4872/m.17540 type:complete len:206 (-) Transcript_4872:866-1483(-)